MASNAGEYRDNEVNILTGVYERGLRSKVKHKHLLEEAREKTGLTSERIMQWIHSRACREKAKLNGKTKTKLAIRKPTLYSTALSEVLRNETNGATIRDRAKYQGAEWKRILEDSEKLDRVKLLHKKKLEEYNQRIENPTSDERKRRDKYLIKKMEKLIEDLEKNGTEVAMVLVHKSFSSCTTRGSQLGEDFFDERRDILQAFFQKCIGSHAPLIYKPLMELRRLVTSIWNDKYSRSIGRICRVPYLSISRREMSVILHGTDIKFKEAKFYRRHELESIIENQASLTIQVEWSPQTTRSSGSTSNEPPMVQASEPDLPEVEETQNVRDCVNNSSSTQELHNETRVESITLVPELDNNQDAESQQADQLQPSEAENGFVNMDGTLMEVVLEDESSEETNLTKPIQQVQKGSLLVSKWGECGEYFGYVQHTYIEWSSRPIILVNQRIFGIKKSFKVGVSPKHRTELTDYGQIICEIPKLLYKKEKNTIYPTMGFHEYVQSLLKK